MFTKGGLTNYDIELSCLIRIKKDRGPKTKSPGHSLLHRCLNSKRTRVTHLQIYQNSYHTVTSKRQSNTSPISKVSELYRPWSVCKFAMGSNQLTYSSVLETSEMVKSPEKDNTQYGSPCINILEQIAVVNYFSLLLDFTINLF